MLMSKRLLQRAYKDSPRADSPGRRYSKKTSAGLGVKFPPTYQFPIQIR